MSRNTQWHYSVSGGVHKIYAPSLLTTGELVELAQTSSSDMAQLIIRIPEAMELIMKIADNEDWLRGVLDEERREELERIREDLVTAMKDLSLAYSTEPRMGLMPF